MTAARVTPDFAAHAHPVRSTVGSTANRWACWTVSVAWCFLSGLTAAADAQPAAKPAQAAEAANIDQPAPPRNGPGKPAPTPEQKRKVVVVSTLMMAGILAVLLLLLLWVVWWSRRTHRLLREPLPSASRGDELWYLKTKRPPAPPTDQSSDVPPIPPST